MFLLHVILYTAPGLVPFPLYSFSSIFILSYFTLVVQVFQKTGQWRKSRWLVYSFTMYLQNTQFKNCYRFKFHFINLRDDIIYISCERTLLTSTRLSFSFQYKVAGMLSDDVLSHESTEANIPDAWWKASHIVLTVLTLSLISAELMLPRGSQPAPMSALKLKRHSFSLRFRCTYFFML